MINFNDLQTNANVKNAAKAVVIEKLIEFLKKEFGDEQTSIIGSNKIAVCVGYRKNSYGEPQEVCVEITSVAKDFEDRKTANKTFSTFKRKSKEEEYKKICKDKTRKRKTENV